MIIKLQTQNNKNGNKKQLVIDTDAKTYNSGNCLFIGADVTRLTQTQLNEFVQTLQNNGYTKTEA